MYRQMHSQSADNWHMGRYIVQSADIVQSANDWMSADYLLYQIGRISESAEFLSLDIICTLLLPTFECQATPNSLLPRVFLSINV